MLEINKIYLADCFDTIYEINDNSIDMIITDPPYYVDYKNKSKALAKIGKARTKQIERDKHFEKPDIFRYLTFVREVDRILKNNSHIYIFCGMMQLFEWNEFMNKVNIKLNDILIWLKPHQTFDLSMGYHYNYRTEYCMFFNKGKRKLNKLGLSNVLEYDTDKKYNHPTQKPISMFNFLIKNSSNKNEIVFDPFIGSGTTAIACKQLKRKFIGFEISKEYYTLANKRINKTQCIKNIDNF